MPKCFGHRLLTFLTRQIDPYMHRVSSKRALESYNKQFNGIRPTGHPNLVSFCHALRQEADRVVQHTDDVAKGREIPLDWDEVVFPQTPPEFYA